VLHVLQSAVAALLKLSAVNAQMVPTIAQTQVFATLPVWTDSMQIMRLGAAKPVLLLVQNVPALSFALSVW